MNEAIQLFNTIFEYCEIRLMMPVEVGGPEVYIDVNGLRCCWIIINCYYVTRVNSRFSSSWIAKRKEKYKRFHKKI